jgi:lysozyme family protein
MKAFYAIVAVIVFFLVILPKNDGLTYADSYVVSQTETDMEQYRLGYAEFVLLHEGKLSNHPKDPGGLTNQGVTYTTFKNLGKQLDYNPTLDLFYEMPDSVWYMIFDYHWNLFDGLDNPQLRMLAVDFVWGSGTTGVRKIQEAIKNQIHHQEVDGVLGSNTLKNMNNCDYYLLMKDVRKNRIELFKNSKNSKYFYKGWLKRQASLDKYLFLY